MKDNMDSTKATKISSNVKKKISESYEKKHQRLVEREILLSRLIANLFIDYS